MPNSNNSKKKVMSLAVEPELQDELKLYAKKKGMSISAYVGKVMKKALKLKVEDEPLVAGIPAGEEVYPIVLYVPKDLKGDALNEWLNNKTSKIAESLS